MQGNIAIRGSVKRREEVITSRSNTGRSAKVNMLLVVYYSQFLPYSWCERQPGAFRLPIETSAHIM
jgi:hypothetical protein